jgi:uncharacterized protein
MSPSSPAAILSTKLNFSNSFGAGTASPANIFPIKLFRGRDGITCEHLPQKKGGELFENVDFLRWPYDVVVLYNFSQEITPKQQENFVRLLNMGMGLVILHHANDAYPAWPLYAEISGVQSHSQPWRQNGVALAPSDYSRGRVALKIHMEDSKHPITEGMKDYEASDETYCRRSYSPDNHVLLTTEEPSSDTYIAWTRSFHGKNRVFYIQSGHDETTYQNPAYREIVLRAIRWTAGEM